MQWYADLIFCALLAYSPVHLEHLGKFILVKSVFQLRRQPEMILSFRCCIIGSGVGLLARKIKLTVKAGFSLLGGMGGESGKFAHPPSPHLEKSASSRLLPPPKVNSPLLNNNFQVITYKNSIFSSSHCSCFSFVFISYSGHAGYVNFDSNWCAVFTESCF